MQQGFDNEKYLRIQSERIKERIGHFEGKLYLEFGGKLFDDYHASRVLPGFEPDSKLRMLMQLSDEAEVVIAINAEDIERSKRRGDLGITYDEDVLRLCAMFEERGLSVCAVVITRYTPSPAVTQFKQRIERKKIRVYRHYSIEGYPNDVATIVSERGYGKNEYIETAKPLVIVTAPGPGSGKMATCLSQLYHENKRGVRAGYAKFETFPVWNLPLKHPVNLAYEAATADLNDVNMIDPFHLQAYGETTVNYNRDVAVFPVLNAMFERIFGESPYKSPTDMGVNMVGFCITDDSVCCEASKQEIVRRFFTAKDRVLREAGSEEEVFKIELLMKQAGVTPACRHVVTPCLERAKKEGAPAMAIELPDATIVTGGSTKLLGACSAGVLNALKALAGIEHKIHLIAPEAIEPIQKLKTSYLGAHNPALHIDETLIALSTSAASNDLARRALNELPKLRGAQVHTSCLLAQVDEIMFQRLGMQVTSEPVVDKRRYQK